MFTNRSFARFAAVLAFAALISATAAGNDEKEQELIRLLQSDAPPQEKALACKRLSVCGTPAAVPALAALLSDKDLASWARIALEVIPGPAADAALREAMGKLKGRLQLGVISSIGVRRDAKAIGALVGLLKGSDADAASAAAAALGQIGGPEAVKALEPALAGGPIEVRSAAAEGCILCAEKLLAEGKDADAVGLYERVRKADVPGQRVLEATRGVILAKKSAGIPMLLELLKSKDKKLFHVGLSTARELPGSEATGALVAELERLAPDRQALLVLALSDRGDPKALPALLGAIQRGPKEAGLAAMGAMGRIGDASCVPVLLKAVVEAEKDVAAAAKVALARLPGADVDADMAARLPKTSGKAHVVLLEMVGQRRIESALPAVLASARS
ncbi:MAG: HEAT repeat domain-containing protein, partial [Planctomycetota bacterium]